MIFLRKLFIHNQYRAQSAMPLLIHSIFHSIYQSISICSLSIRFFVPACKPCKPLAPQARSAFPDKIVTIQNIVFPKLCSRIFKKLYGPETRPVALRKIKGMA